MLTSAVASLDADSAKVLVVSDARVKTVFDSNVARHFRWEVSLVKIDGPVARRRLHPRRMSSPTPRPAPSPHRRRAASPRGPGGGGTDRRPAGPRPAATLGATLGATPAADADPGGGPGRAAAPGGHPPGARRGRRRPRPRWRVIGLLGGLALRRGRAGRARPGTWNFGEVREQDAVAEAARSAPSAAERAAAAILSYGYQLARRGREVRGAVHDAVVQQEVRQHVRRLVRPNAANVHAKVVRRVKASGVATPTRPGQRAGVRQPDQPSPPIGEAFCAPLLIFNFQPATFNSEISICDIIHNAKGAGRRFTVTQTRRWLGLALLIYGSVGIVVMLRLLSLLAQAFGLWLGGSGDALRPIIPGLGPLEAHYDARPWLAWLAWLLGLLLVAPPFLDERIEPKPIPVPPEPVAAHPIALRAEDGQQNEVNPAPTEVKPARPLAQFTIRNSQFIIPILLIIVMLAAGAYTRLNLLVPQEKGLIEYPYDDEGVYAEASQLTLQGILPYRDYFFAHPPVASLVYAPAFAYHFTAWGSPTSFMLGRYLSVGYSLLTALALFFLARKAAQGMKAIRLYADLSGGVAALLWAIDGQVVEIIAR